LAGCAAWEIDEAVSRDVNAVTSTVGERTGIDLSHLSHDVDDDTLAIEVQRLLESPLNEGTALTIALVGNRRLRQEIEAVGIARADLIQAGLLKNPQLRGEALLFSGGTELDVGITKSVLDVLFLRLREHIAKDHLRAARARLGSAIVTLVADVRRSVVDVRAAGRLRELRTKLRSVAEATRKLTEKLHAAGNITDLDLARARATEARARLELARAELDETEARESLNVDLGVWGKDIEWTLTEREPNSPSLPPDLERIESLAILSSFDLAAEHAHVDAAAQEAGVAAWKAILPPIDVGVGALREIDSSWGIGPTGAIAIPIFDQGHARSAASRARLRQSLARYWRTAVEIRATARRLRARLVSLRDRAHYQREVLAPLEEALVLETVRNYNAMQIGAFDVLEQRQQELDAALEHAATSREAWRSRIDLDELLAGSLRPMRSLQLTSRANGKTARDTQEH
jgi:cobalt-zinc-cadmium efflux system outer membrane protein